MALRVRKRTFPSYSNPFRTWDYGIWLLSCSLCSESSNGYYQFFPSCFTGHFRDLSSLQRWDNSSSATLEKKKSYYYKPNNMISISNLVFRMKKNAVGLATIAILSSMVLVTLVGAASIYAGKKTIWRVLLHMITQLPERM